MTDEGELEPGRRRLELLEEVRERDPHNEAILRCHVDVNDEVTRGYRLEEQVHVATGESDRLAARLGQLDVVAGRDRANDTVHGTLDGLVLENNVSHIKR